MKKIVSAILMVAVILATVLSVSATAEIHYDGEEFKATVINSEAPVYSKADKSSSVFGVLGTGKTVTVKEVRGNWAKVEKNGKIGFMKFKNLLADSPIMIGNVTKDSEIIAVRVNGKTICRSVNVKAGTRLYVYSYDEGGRFLVGNRSQSNLGYIDRNLVK